MIDVEEKKEILSYIIAQNKKENEKKLTQALEYEKELENFFSLPLPSLLLPRSINHVFYFYDLFWCIFLLFLDFSRFFSSLCGAIINISYFTIW